MKKEEKRTAPGLKGALKAVLGHKIVRLAGIAGVSLLFSASVAQTVLADDAGVWQPVENGYYLVGMDGSYLTGWQQMGGKWYLLGADGLMKTGWEQENGTWYYLQGDGAMATGWQNIDGKYYFLKDSGAMEGTTFTKDVYDQRGRQPGERQKEEKHGRRRVHAGISGWRYPGDGGQLE